jgi:hypothetical protein
MAFSDSDAAELFEGVLPGPGEEDEGALLVDADYQSFDVIHQYSDLDYSEIRTTLGFNYRLSPNMGIFGAVSRYDLDDDAPYLQDSTGSVEIYSGGLTWTY